LGLQQLDKRYGTGNHDKTPCEQIESDVVVKNSFFDKDNKPACRVDIKDNLHWAS
jgi:hypothetical protein